MISFDEIYMNLAVSISKRSHCVKKQVGTVIVKNTRPISIGYNGPPPGSVNCDEKYPEKGCPKSLNGSCFLALHAEENAIIHALNNKIDLKNSTLYTTLSPCLSCARFILVAGIKEVFYLQRYSEYKGLKEDEGIKFLTDFSFKISTFKHAK